MPGRVPISGQGAVAHGPLAGPSAARTRSTNAVWRTNKRREALTTFKELGALPEIVDALERVGITEPFPIQEMAVPIALTGADLIAQARTGTGKTLAFGVPLLQRIVVPHDRDFADLVAPGKPQALVVAPTRELALQVTDDLTKAGSIREVRVLTVYGGVAYEPQLDALKTGVEVVVGTPGRLLDLADRSALDLSHVKVLVLDEADRMLDLGFLPDVERLIRLTHELRQTMLFSATMPGDVVQLARRHMRHPVNVRAEAADESQVVPATAQFVYRCHDLDKNEVVARILQAESRGRAIVFCTTKRMAQRVADDLGERGFAAAAIHGDLGQIARERALERFRSGKADVLVATDVAARGIDVEGVTHVVNYTCPDDDKTYVHRIGRTGRAGASGVAVTFVDWPDVARWKVINTTLGLPYPDPVETYSTSDHLFHDIGIPKDVTGQVGAPRGKAAARPTEGEGEGEGREGRRSRSRRRSRSADRASVDPSGSEGGASDHDGDEEATAEPTHKRRRRRLRSGVVVAENGAHTDDSTPADGPATNVEPESAAVEDESGDAEATAARPARRRRTRTRRRRGADEVEGAQAAQAAGLETHAGSPAGPAES
ncbi:DEAD/DEAH box helicase [Actinopolymorpha alba]|uniref:DEAD/DEAH box helicase n=1 Tax=Actinopolymorpha alba TaxID=533267 RepID=UPI00036029BC|nr:DEAD/DEAH box helicase [Actinopolymorpha alba]